jgi:putative beta-lysine N-acetyltransferase
MKTDLIQKIDNSLVHSGNFNKRIFVLKLDKRDVPAIIRKIEDIAYKKQFTKIIYKVPAVLLEKFLSERYIIEAIIPKYFNEKEECYLMANYLNPKRAIDSNMEKVKENIELAKSKYREEPETDYSNTVKQLGSDNTSELSSLYKNVFKTYPFPIMEEDYIIKTMNDNVDYFGVYDDDNLIAAASAEKDIINKNAEMTDFATLPEYRGNSYSSLLLNHMEKSLIKDNYRVLYTISRALSPGMNITFSKNAYKHAGTLINNTNICGKIESMNVWYKTLI